MKDHQERLGRQTAALQLLLTAIQWCVYCPSREHSSYLRLHSHTISEQTTLLRSPENAKKIQKIADDTSTIRATRSQIGSTGTPSIKSQDHSSVASRAFPWDDQLITTGPYRRAFNHHRSKSDLPPRALSPKIDVHIHDSPVDEGYETMSKATVDSTQSGDHCKYNRSVHSHRFTL